MAEDQLPEERVGCGLRAAIAKPYLNPFPWRQVPQDTQLSGAPRAGESPLAPKQGNRRPPAQDLPWMPSNQADKEMTHGRHQGLIIRLSMREGQKFLF